jgi:hypothetical protein
MSALVNKPEQKVAVASKKSDRYEEIILPLLKQSKEGTKRGTVANIQFPVK